MQRESDSPRGGAWVLCVGLSLLLHAAAVGVLLLLPPPQKKSVRQAARPTRMVKVVRAEEPKDAAAEQPQGEDAEKAFVKTSADTPERTPEHADYESNHSTRAASAADADSTAAAPAMDGRERREDEEIVTFDQERQDGPLEHEGKQQTPPTPPAPPVLTETEDGTDEPAAEGRPDALAESEERGQDAATTLPPSALTAQPLPDDTTGELRLREADADTVAEGAREQHAAPQGSPDETGAGKQAAARPRRPVFDPSLASDSPLQAGFRTNERRTRSSGQFVLGRGAALNVAATPRGMYEAEIYRRIAALWYVACDDHRGDIIPGSLTVSIRIDRRGRLANMQLITRRGASMSQQSFTFNCIRRAALPPMPANVQGDIVGNVLELIFTFHFD